jgi:serine phosphatase RsbU (regulator of sigma subunit)/anti-sigma regulatory factor (Ser/Thr protein kinase)
VQRLKLPADRRTPAAARAAVRALVLEAGLTALLDEAMLLTTELATNAVVHAGTELEVDIAADPDGLTVTVIDSRPGPLTDHRDPGSQGLARDRPEDERGRGLLLVDQLASSWGTVHHPGGKGVWFRLDRSRKDGRPPVDVGALARIQSGSAEALDPVDALAALGGALEARDSAGLTEVVDGVLRRVGAMLCANSGALLVDQNDGLGPRAVAAYGASTSQLDGGLRIALKVSRPWRGELIFGVGDPTHVPPLVRLAAERLTLLVENYRLRRTDRERRSWLTFLAEASDLLAQCLDVQLTLALIPRLVVPRLGPWCAVHVLDEDGELRLAASTHSDESVMPKLLDMLEASRPQLLEAVGLEAAMPLTAPTDGVAVALISRGQRLGTLAVGRDPDRWQSPDEVAVVEDVARRAALAIDNSRIYAERRAVAQALQRSLLPPQLPAVAGIELGAEYVPTGEAVDVGGDFYDVVQLPDGRWLIVVGDVSGKGVQAATVTGLVRDVTRALVRDGRPLPETLARLNETLVERGGGRFCTLVLAALGPRVDGVLKVSLHLAGHDQPVLVHPDGSTRLVGRNGTALGLLPTVRTPAAQLALGPGDMLVFFTDGVTERRNNGQLFGVERLRREASALAGFPAEVVAGRLRAAAVGFSSEPPRDDIAIFTMRNDG